jgi:PhnB protein
MNAGARVMMPMTDMFFGSREGRVADSFGGTWTISTRIKIVSPRESAAARYVEVMLS